MTTTTPTLPTPRPFASLQVDPQKAQAGVWITHPDTGDKVRIRRRFNPEHVAAYHAARAEYEAKHGAGSGESDAGDLAIDAVAMSRAVVVDWQLAGDPRPYDAAEMAAMLADPEYDELRLWIVSQCQRRANFRPEVQS